MLEDTCRAVRLFIAECCDLAPGNDPWPKAPYREPFANLHLEFLAWQSRRFAGLLGAALTEEQLRAELLAYRPRLILTVRTRSGSRLTYGLRLRRSPVSDAAEGVEHGPRVDHRKDQGEQKP